jgi:hypothetical protein
MRDSTSSMVPRLSPPTSHLHVAVCALAAILVAGCSSGGDSSGSMARFDSPVSDAATTQEHGRFIGSVKVCAEERFGDALLTVDGVLRLYVGGASASDGTLQLRVRRALCSSSARSLRSEAASPAMAS